MPSALFPMPGAKLVAMKHTTQDALFLAGRDVPAEVPAKAALPPAEPRLRRADRAQMVIRPCFIEDLLEPDHLARVVWALVCRWGLGLFLETIAARGEASGRAATDPKILLCLWLYAHTQDVGNGRELDRLCNDHRAYQWICGGVSLNYHTINDFRVNHAGALDELLSQMIAALLDAELISVDRLSVDGTRVRAGAGRNSFKTASTLERHLQEARAHVKSLKEQAQDPTISAQRRAALERAARQRMERVEKSMEEIQKIQQAKDAQKEKASKHQPAKASETDPEARQMRMPGGGTAPAYNVQLAVATEGRAIVGVSVTSEGSDVRQSQPMLQQVKDRSGREVQDQLVDGGYIGLDSVDQSAAAGTTLYAPVSAPKKAGIERHQPKKGDSQAVADWRRRMGTLEAQAIYKERASTVETANGECKTYRGLTQFCVRGIVKVTCVALWSALAYNLVHFGRRLLM
jgi:transposase